MPKLCSLRRYLAVIHDLSYGHSFGFFVRHHDFTAERFTSAFSSVDVLMVGQLGENVLNGISIGGQLLWILNRLFAGLSAGGLVFMTQYRGSGKSRAIRDCFFKMTLLMSCAAVLFALAGGIFPRQIVRLFTREDAIAAVSVPYLRISVFSYLPLAWSSACTMLLLACGRTGISLLAGSISAGLHILGNQFFIFGGRLPGGEGAAAAALLAAAGSLLFQLPFVLRILFSDSSGRAPVSVSVSSYLKISAMLIAHEGIWGAGIFTYNLIFSNLDSGFYAAVVMFRTVSDVFFTASGYQPVTVEDGTYRVRLDTQKSVDIVEKCAAIFGNPDTMNPNLNSDGSSLRLFSAGRAVFVDADINSMMSFRDMEDDFGIIPVPKLEETQETYLTACNTWLPNGIAVPLTCADPEKTGLILETMAVLSKDSIMPAAYETTLQGKVARDDVSARMLDIIFGNSSFDFITVFDFGGSSLLLRTCQPWNYRNTDTGIRRLIRSEESAGTISCISWVQKTFWIACRVCFAVGLFGSEYRYEVFRLLVFSEVTYKH